MVKESSEINYCNKNEDLPDGPRFCSLLGAWMLVLEINVSSGWQHIKITKGQLTDTRMRARAAAAAVARSPQTSVATH